MRRRILFRRSVAPQHQGRGADRSVSRHHNTDDGAATQSLPAPPGEAPDAVPDEVPEEVIDRINDRRGAFRLESRLDQAIKPIQDGDANRSRAQGKIIGAAFEPARGS